MKKERIIYFSIFLILLAYCFRSLIIGLSTNLPDWYDYPFVTWIINSNLDKVISLNFSKLFETNILYPNHNALLLTETLITQTILALPFRIFTKNPILIFNLVFLLTFILNYLAAYAFWGKIFKKEQLAFLGAILVVFSPFLHAEWSHFQLQSYWPAFLCLYFIFESARKVKRTKYLILSGLFLGLQFLASVYLAVFLLAAVGLYFLTLSILNRSILIPVKDLLIILVSFAVLTSPVIVGYVNVQRQYKVERNYGEYVFYSAHLSDYLFSRGIKSVIHNICPINKWNSFNHHTIGGVALFPGFVLSILGGLGILVSRLKKNKDDLFFFLVTGVGMFFSLGPRINFNGVYSGIPLPYHFLVKYFPFVDAVRAPSRWMFLFYIGLTFFALKFLSRKALKPILFSLLTIFIILEYLPISISTHAENYILEKDRTLFNICSKNTKVVLEVPVTHFDAGENILAGLNYISKTILASTYHKCLLVNGYSSYDLPSVAVLKNSLYDASSEGNLDKFASVIKSSQADILVVNRDLLKIEVKDDFLAMIKKLEAKHYLLHLEGNVYQIRIP